MMTRLSALPTGSGALGRTSQDACVRSIEYIVASSDASPMIGRSTPLARNSTSVVAVTHRLRE